MDKFLFDFGLFNSCDIGDAGSICFYLFLPIGIVVFLFDEFF